MDHTEPEIEYRRLPLSCECGAVAKYLSGVGISSTHKFVAHWRCPQCHRDVWVEKSLLECWKDCYFEPSVKLSNSRLPMDTPDDRKFLHAIGVAYADE